MPLLLIAAALAAASTDPAIPPCKLALARKAGGEISTIEVDRVHVGAGGRTISGRLTAFLGMGPPPPGSASAHHLIRADFTYRCRLKGGRVREAAVNPLKL